MIVLASSRSLFYIPTFCTWKRHSAYNTCYPWLKQVSMKNHFVVNCFSIFKLFCLILKCNYWLVHFLHWALQMTPFLRVTYWMTPFLYLFTIAAFVFDCHMLHEDTPSNSDHNKHLHKGNLAKLWWPCPSFL